MSTPTGLYAHPLLDGYPLSEASIVDTALRGEVPKTVHISAAGAARVRITWQGAGYPLARERRRFELKSEHLGAAHERVSELLADPGLHTLVLWRHEFLAYRCDGTRSEFRLFWPLATDTYAPPNARPAGPMQPVVRISNSETLLTVLSKATVDYEAGAPDAGEVWIETGSTRFKLAAAPSAGLKVLARVVPLYTVVEEPDSTRTYKRAAWEPRTIALVEAA